jgi:hypothetical protein
MVLEEPRDARYRAGRNDDVSIDEKENRTAGVSGAMVPGSRWSGIFFQRQNASTHRAGNGSRAIGRGVVDNNYLSGGRALRLQSGETFTEIVWIVVNRYDD